MTPEEIDALITSLTIFTLAILVGFAVISKVPATLHTPLMSGANSIHGIVLVGAMLIAAEAVGGISQLLSLVAVAFLVSLFIARPSPFYILDEVEAALDDTNLGRLPEIYEELRESSQLLVITHQKRTMEIADALYGITMRGDGVSAVISQRLRDAESA